MDRFTTLTKTGTYVSEEFPLWRMQRAREEGFGLHLKFMRWKNGVQFYVLQVFEW